MVTGANRGIGLQLCRELLAENRPVILVARSAEKAEKSRETLLGELSQEDADSRKDAIRALACDLMSPADIDRLAQTVKAHVRSRDARLVALVNNAGIMTNEWNKQAFEAHMEVNTRAPVRLATLLRDQLAEGHGQVLNVSSGLGCFKYTPKTYVPLLAESDDLDKILNLPYIDKPGSTVKEEAETPERLSYKLSKAALNRACYLLSKDKAWSKVPINVVCPGWVRTDMGTDKASRSPSEGVASVRAILDREPPVPTGTFTRDGREMDWWYGSDGWN